MFLNPFGEFSHHHVIIGNQITEVELGPLEGLVSIDTFHGVDGELVVAQVVIEQAAEVALADGVVGNGVVEAVGLSLLTDV